MNINENFRYLHMGLPEDILRRKLSGDFEGVVRLIDRRLQSPETPEALRRCQMCIRDRIIWESVHRADSHINKEKKMNIQLLASGISMGVVYGLIAMGMVLIFRSVGVMNFAQGEFLMFGGYFCYTFNQMLHIPIVPSLILASLLMGVVGVVFMRTSYWPLRSAQTKAIIVSAMGCLLYTSRCV